MFQVGRYDPSKDDKEKLQKQKTERRRRRRSEDQTNDRTKKVNKKHKETQESSLSTHSTEGIKQTPTSTLRVIAPETDGALSSRRKTNTKLTEEAFDDLDLPTTEDLLLLEDNDEIVSNLKEETDDDDEKEFDPTDEIQRALYMSKKPLAEAANKWGLAPFLVNNLQQDNYQKFFPIQSLVIPDVICGEQALNNVRVRDICVAAPTGSGKTLAFVLPVLNALASRKIRRLRALVVLPSRDLAKQVFEVFDRFAAGSDLKIGLAIGQSNFLAEQKALILGDGDGDSSMSSQQQHRLAQLSYSLDPGNLKKCLEVIDNEMEFLDDLNEDDSITIKRINGGISAVDVLVCTPGRLVDHLDNTPGFTLQHLRFLVIDEADRLLSQSYHGWIGRVLEDAASTATTSQQEQQRQPFELAPDGLSFVIDPITCRQTTLGGGVYCQLRKLLYSATLTKDPQKLAALQLVNPKYFNAHHLTARHREAPTTSSLYSMPDLLKESTIQCTAEQKPLVLLALLLERILQQNKGREDNHKSIIVVFTSSLESTHRLARLLQLLWMSSSGDGGDDEYGEAPFEFSSSLNQQQRSALMKRCNDPNDPGVRIVICSDGMSRGMDIASVGAVVNYDVPGFAKTYVHRCGRTARAGKEGEAISLLKGTGQVALFSKLRRLIDFPERVSTSVKVKTSLIRKFIPLYRDCVASLKHLIAAEDRGDLSSTDRKIEKWLPINNSTSDSSESSEEEE